MKRAFFLILMTMLMGCSESKKDVKKVYFDLQGYFKKEADRLSLRKQSVQKTVSRNGMSETKTAVTIDWASELAHFSESDINKPAWESSYVVQESPASISYSAKDSSLRTRSVRIDKLPGGRLHSVVIVNRTTKFLYQTDEILSYVPDSSYEIRKKQRVVLLGSNTYVISGKF